VLMGQVGSIVHAQHELGGLSAITDAVPLYLHRGWVSWTGATAALDCVGGVIATDDADGRIMLLDNQMHTVAIDRRSVLTSDWRPGD